MNEQQQILLEDINQKLDLNFSKIFDYLTTLYDVNKMINKIQKIVLISNCDFMSETNPNPTREDKKYIAKTVLKIIASDQEYILDCDSGTVLPNDYEIISDTGTPSTIWRNANFVEKSLIEDSNFIKHTYALYIQLSKELGLLNYRNKQKNYADFIETVVANLKQNRNYNSQLNCIECDNVRFFLSIAPDENDIKLENYVSIKDEEEWVNEININDKYFEVCSKEESEQEVSESEFLAQSC